MVLELAVKVPKLGLLDLDLDSPDLVDSGRLVDSEVAREVDSSSTTLEDCSIARNHTGDLPELREAK